MKDIIAAIEAGETELWLHEDQKTSWATGPVILAHLTKTGLLPGCANLEDGKVIQAKGSDFYRKHFGDNIIVLWGSVEGDLVPYLFEDGVEVILVRDRLGSSFFASNPALRRK